MQANLYIQDPRMSIDDLEEDRKKRNKLEEELTVPSDREVLLCIAALIGKLPSCIEEATDELTLTYSFKLTHLVEY